jgi:hypothetical protein
VASSLAITSLCVQSLTRVQLNNGLNRAKTRNMSSACGQEVNLSLRNLTACQDAEAVGITRRQIQHIERRKEESRDIFHRLKFLGERSQTVRPVHTPMLFSVEAITNTIIQHL